MPSTLDLVNVVVVKAGHAYDLVWPFFNLSGGPPPPPPPPGYPKKGHLRSLVMAWSSSMPADRASLAPIVLCIQKSFPAMSNGSTAQIVVDERTSIVYMYQ